MSVRRIDIRGDGSWNASPTGAWVSSREYDALGADFHRYRDKAESRMAALEALLLEFNDANLPGPTNDWDARFDAVIAGLRPATPPYPLPRHPPFRPIVRPMKRWTMHSHGMDAIDATNVDDPRDDFTLNCDEVFVLAKDLPKPCTWTYADDDTGAWDTSCGEAFYMVDDRPAANSYHYCPKCGGQLMEVTPNAT